MCRPAENRRMFFFNFWPANVQKTFGGFLVFDLFFGHSTATHVDHHVLRAAAVLEKRRDLGILERSDNQKTKTPTIKRATYNRKLRLAGQKFRSRFGRRQSRIEQIVRRRERRLLRRLRRLRTLRAARLFGALRLRRLRADRRIAFRRFLHLLRIKSFDSRNHMCGNFGPMRAHRPHNKL